MTKPTHPLAKEMLAEIKTRVRVVFTDGKVEDFTMDHTAVKDIKNTHIFMTVLDHNADLQYLSLHSVKKIIAVDYDWNPVGEDAMYQLHEQALQEDRALNRARRGRP